MMYQKSMFKPIGLLFITIISLLFVMSVLEENKLNLSGISNNTIALICFLFTSVSFALYTKLYLKNTEFGDYGIEIKGTEVFVQQNKGLCRFSNNTFVLSPISFEEPIEKNILLSTKTTDQQEFQIGISLITFHVPKNNNVEIESYVKKYLYLQKEEWEQIDNLEKRTDEILPSIQKELEEKISELPYENIHAALPTIFENTRKEWEEKYAFSIRIKAYYY